MRPSSPHWSSSRARGFTLLELTIAMVFVAVLSGGITLTISTCLKVWERSQESAALNQEARAVIELLSRDIRGAYLGLQRTGGYFLAGAPLSEQGAGSALEFSTESSDITRAALLPDEERAPPGGVLVPPVTDFVAARWELFEPAAAAPGGLWRTIWVAPTSEWAEIGPPEDAPAGHEVVAESVVGFEAMYYDGEEWIDSWSTAGGDARMPQAVAVKLTLLDARGNEHVYQSIIPIAAR